MADRTSRWETLEALLHLNDEDVALLASGEPCEALIAAHAADCAPCALRVEEARDLLQIEPFSRRADPSRVQTLMDRLTAIGAVSPEAARAAHLSVAFGPEGAIHILSTDTEVRIQRAVAVRSADPAGQPGVTFFRQLGGVEVEVHLVRVPGGTFHLAVGVRCPDARSEARVVLHRGHRELAAMPAPHGTATFKSLRPATYRLEIQDRGVTVGFVEVEVASENAPEVNR